MMRIAPIAAWLVLSTGPGLADVIVFDNRTETFLMHPYHSAGGTYWPGNYFDPTRSPEQNPFAGPTSIRAESGSAPASDICLPDDFLGGVIGGSSSVFFARNGPTYTPCPGGQTMSLATTFSSGSLVGPATAPPGGWPYRAEFGYSRTGGPIPQLGSPATIGFRLTLVDGVHYGWAAFAWRNMSPQAGYTPIAWGYESAPGAAIAVPPLCYANCDLSAAPPVLNLNDFICFLNRFAAGDPYANCDASTQPPLLNVLDFTCFLNRLAAGCS